MKHKNDAKKSIDLGNDVTKLKKLMVNISTEFNKMSQNDKYIKLIYRDIYKN